MRPTGSPRASARHASWLLRASIVTDLAIGGNPTAPRSILVAAAKSGCPRRGTRVAAAAGLEPRTAARQDTCQLPRQGVRHREVHLPDLAAGPERAAVLPAGDRASRGDAADYLHPD